MMQYRAMARRIKARDAFAAQYPKFATSVIVTAEKYAHEYWLAVIAIKRHYRMAEYDEMYKDLYKEYRILKSKKGFIVTDEIYRKYSEIQSAFVELFVHGITHDVAVVSKIEEAAKIMGKFNEQIERIMKESDEARNPKATPVTFSANGNSKNKVAPPTINSVQFPIILLAFSLATFLCSCGSNTNVVPLPINAITNIDLSGSRDSSNLGSYKDVGSNHIVGNLKPDACFVVTPIDLGSVQAGEEIAIKDFSQDNYENESAGQSQTEITMNLHHDSVQAVQKRFEASFENAVATRKYKGRTDIIGAIIQDKKYYRPGHKNIIFLLSDMLIYENYGSGLVDFEHRLNDTTEIKAMLSKVPTVDLSGFRVVVFTGKTHIAADKYGVVEEFWKRWFLSCHADLVLYTSGAISLLDKELTQ